MGLWEKLKGEIIDIVQWLDESGDTMVHRFERYGNEIKYGAKLVVRESQVAVFVNEGKLADIFQPGTYTLQTQNMPIMTTLQNWRHGFESPFKAEVYFVNMKSFTDNKWGTKNPIMLRDPEFGPIRLRAFGSYSIRVKDPAAIVRGVSGTNGTFTVDGISEQLKNLIITRFTDAIGKSKIPALDMAANYVDLGEIIKKQISPEFENYGIEITTMLIENISLPPEVEEALDKRTSMGIIGNLNAYTQFQAANALETSAQNGGSTSEMMNMGMGMAMAGQMMNMMGNMNNSNFGAQQPPSFNQPPAFNQANFHVNINGQQQGPFDMNTLQAMVRDGRLKQDTFVWKNGMPEWKQASSVAELNSLFAQVPPPMSPPPVQTAPPPIQTAPKIEFFANINNQQTGPHDFEALKQLVNDGKLTKETLVWKNGMANWEMSKNVEELSSIFPITPPPVIPPPVQTAPPPVPTATVVTPPPVNSDILLKEVQKGQKLSISSEVGSLNFKAEINWDNSNSSNYEISTSAFLLSERGKLEVEENFVFYNNNTSKDGSVQILDTKVPNKKVFSLDLAKCSDDIQKILLILTIDEGDKLGQTAENLKDLSINIFNNSGVKYKIQGLTKETAIILFELYKRNGEWKFQGVGDGFNSGLPAIIQQYASENIDL
ncbi:MAG: SPFH domain-containing protein [Candidatus Sericytochromatia bacterium]